MSIGLDMHNIDAQKKVRFENGVTKDLHSPKVELNFERLKKCKETIREQLEEIKRSKTPSELNFKEKYVQLGGHFKRLNELDGETSSLLDERESIDREDLKVLHSRRLLQQRSATLGDKITSQTENLQIQALKEQIKALNDKLQVIEEQREAEKQDMAEDFKQKLKKTFDTYTLTIQRLEAEKRKDARKIDRQQKRIAYLESKQLKEKEGDKIKNLVITRLSNEKQASLNEIEALLEKTEMLQNENKVLLSENETLFNERNQVKEELEAIQKSMIHIQKQNHELRMKQDKITVCSKLQLKNENEKLAEPTEPELKSLEYKKLEPVLLKGKDSILDKGIKGDVEENLIADNGNDSDDNGNDGNGSDDKNKNNKNKNNNNNNIDSINKKIIGDADGLTESVDENIDSIASFDSHRTCNLGKVENAAHVSRDGELANEPEHENGIENTPQLLREAFNYNPHRLNPYDATFDLPKTPENRDTLNLLRQQYDTHIYQGIGSHKARENNNDWSSPGLTTKELLKENNFLQMDASTLKQMHFV